MATINSTLSTPLHAIMREMVADMTAICRNQKTPISWREKYWSAVPYIEALMCLEKPTDKYGYDKGTYLINYLLGNLSQYRGEKAKEFKALLKQLAK